MPNEDINAMLLQNFGFEIAVWPIERFKARRTNPKRHRHKDLAALHESFSQTGFKDFIKYDPVADEIIDGHGRVAQAISDGMKALPVLIVRDLTPDKVKLLAILYNRAPELSSYDEKMLIENLAELRNLDVDFSYLGYDKYKNDIDMAIGSKLDMVEEVQRVAATQAVQYAESQALGSEDPFTMLQNTALPQPKMPGAALPLAPMQSSALKKETGMGLADTIFPGEPEFGIPMLSLDYEAKEVPAKFAKWAELSAKDKEIMGWHFYTKDYKLTNIWYNPDLLLAGKASIFAEVNFSIRNAHGRAYALGEIERKRKIARWLQSKGRYILVDLNVGRKYLQDNFLGVPLGWKSYITRGSVEKLPYILDQFDAAIKHAQGDEIFGVIYGGGVDVEDFAKEAGAVYVPERMTAVRENGSDGMAPKVAPSEYKKQKAVS
jgi:hypothetical protein